MLRGRVLALSASRGVIDVGGVGFTFLATPATLAGLRVDEEAQVHTSLVVREDSLTLFAFADEDERATFEVLQSVSGVGPKLALAILAVHTPDTLRSVVASNDSRALERVPGIGKKGAARIILDLGNKLGPARESAPHAAPAQQSGDVLDALIGLGWAEREAGAALDEAMASQPSADVPTLLRLSLQILGQKR